MKNCILTTTLCIGLLLLCTACNQASQPAASTDTAAQSSVSSHIQPSSSAPALDSVSSAENSSPETVPPTQPGQITGITTPIDAQVRLTFGENEAIVTLVDNATTRDFVSKLPLTQTFEDFTSIEKICRLPDTLSVEGVEQGVDPAVADITLYVPWNPLVFYYEDFGYHADLIPVGRVGSGMDLLEAQTEDFTVTMELITGFEEATSDTTNTSDAVQSTDITMTVGDTLITATLDDSETSKAFLATLPRSISMSEYGEREYYGRIEAISENGTSIPDFENGDVTYYPAGPSFAVFYANSDRSDLGGLIRMGKITSDLAAFEALGESVEMRIAVAD